MTRFCTLWPDSVRSFKTILYWTQSWFTDSSWELVSQSIRQRSFGWLHALINRIALSSGMYGLAGDFSKYACGTAPRLIRAHINCAVYLYGTRTLINALFTTTDPFSQTALTNFPIQAYPEQVVVKVENTSISRKVKVILVAPADNKHLKILNRFPRTFFPSWFAVAPSNHPQMASSSAVCLLRLQRSFSHCGIDTNNSTISKYPHLTLYVSGVSQKTSEMGILMFRPLLTRWRKRLGSREWMALRRRRRYHRSGRFPTLQQKVTKNEIQHESKIWYT